MKGRLRKAKQAVDLEDRSSNNSEMPQTELMPYGARLFGIRALQAGSHGGVVQAKAIPRQSSVMRHRRLSEKAETASLDGFMDNHLDRRSILDLNQINSKWRHHKRNLAADLGDFTNLGQLYNSSPNIRTYPVEQLKGNEARRYDWPLSHRASARSLDDRYNFQHFAPTLHSNPPLVQRHSRKECKDTVRLLVHMTPIPKDWRKRRSGTLPVLPSRSLLGLKSLCRRLRSYRSLDKFEDIPTERLMPDWPCFPDDFWVKPTLAISTLTAYSGPLDRYNKAYNHARQNSEASARDTL